MRRHSPAERTRIQRICAPLIAVTLLASANSCDSPSEPAPPARITVAGAIRAHATGEPIPGASVMIAYLPPGVIIGGIAAIGMSDASGRYALEVVREPCIPEEYELMAIARDHMPASAALRCGDQTIDLTLEPFPEPVPP